MSTTQKISKHSVHQPTTYKTVDVYSVNKVNIHPLTGSHNYTFWCIPELEFLRREGLLENFEAESEKPGDNNDANLLSKWIKEDQNAR